MAQHESEKWSAGYASDILEAFNKYVFPFIGQRPVADIKPLELLNVRMTVFMPIFRVLAVSRISAPLKIISVICSLIPGLRAS